jgi:ribosome-associated translation inhibitor RaiA
MQVKNRRRDCDCKDRGQETFDERSVTMEILQVTFRNMKPSRIVEQWVREEAEKLESFYDRIIICRVAVEAPHKHHGSLFHVRIDLTLPGSELMIKRESHLNDRVRARSAKETGNQLEAEAPYAHIRVAINDAFKAAGRRVQDYARRQRGDVKTHRLGARARIGQLAMA